MTERAASRPWTEEEDALLRQAVAKYGENDNWKIIASSIPGRSNKACRKRWLHSLQPNVKKSAWTSEEDQQLLELYDLHGPKWSMIARRIEGRTDDACSKRYREALDPSLKKDQWTQEEDAKLIEVHSHIGGKWGQVGQELQRSGLACRNRWRLLERKKSAKNQSSSPVQYAGQSAFAVHAPSPLAISSEISPSQEPAPQAHWPLYYPPEAYATLNSTGEGNTLVQPFQAPTPPLDIPNPAVAPFQFSSSSLSAALSDPPQPYCPLPPASVTNTPELYQEPLHELEPPDLSPLSQLPEMQDVLMSLDDSSQIPLEHNPHLQIATSQLPFESDGFFLPYVDGLSYVSPIAIPTDLATDFFHDLWKIRSTDELEFDSPHSVLDCLVDFTDMPEPFSLPSTPFFASNHLSPNSSPNPVAFAELPNLESPSSGSLLLSPADYSRRSPKKTVRKHKASMKIPVPSRLSSTLPLSTDPNIKPYACGRPSCWPIGCETSLHCFSTSGELQDHSKEQHGNEESSDKPYRCALAGCGKSWKSLNGLQYHLQISAVHFTNALHDKFSKQPATPVQQMSMLSTDGDSEDSDRRYPCPTLGCYKAYRQPSGLRYHLKHGHPPDLPTQLNFVPPALERQLPAKAKRMRPKPSPESTQAVVQAEFPGSLGATS